MIGTSDPLLIYSLPMPKPCGSHSKLTTLFASMYGGIVAHGNDGALVVRPQERDGDIALRQAIVRHKPDMCVVLGDYYIQWRVCQELGVPYIISQHDTHSLSESDALPDYSDIEQVMFDGASAVIFANEDHERIMTAKFDIKCATMTAFPKPFMADLAFTPLPKTENKSIVYIGGLIPKWQQHGLAGYKALGDVFALFVKAGWEVHTYSPQLQSDVLDEYTKVGAECHGFVPHSEMYREISQYHAGFVGYNPDSDMTYVQNCVPGKFFDYVAAGLPSICHHVGTFTDYIVDGGYGVEWPCDDLPTITDEMRQRETMDAYEPELRRLVSKAMLRNQFAGGIHI